MRISASVLMPSPARNHTLPPRPPSPPSGPPKGMDFSRRKLTEPRPPLPACTLSVASSTNFMSHAPTKKNPGLAGVSFANIACRHDRFSSVHFSRRRRRRIRQHAYVQALVGALDVELDAAR